MTRKRKSTDWQMQPKVNQTHGAQGTLFHGGPHRWPRGFTPERGAEVARAVTVVGAALPHDPQRAFDRKAWGQERISRQRTLDNIARSTVPMSDFEGERIHVQSVSPQLQPYRPPLNQGAAGVYRGKRSKTHEIQVRQDHETSSTVIHELGHAVSNIRGTAHSAYDTPAVRGTEEAYADDYAARHFRDRRGRPETQFEYHPDDALAPSHQDKADFSAAYRGARTTSLPKGSFELMEEHDQFQRDNPTLPGMERMKRSGGYFGEAPHPMYERPYDYQRRMEARQRELRSVGS